MLRLELEANDDKIKEMVDNNKCICGKKLKNYFALAGLCKYVNEKVVF